MKLTKEEIQMFVDADKNKTNGPLPLSPEEAEQAALARDEIIRQKFKENTQQCIFNMRCEIEEAQRNRLDYVAWNSDFGLLFNSAGYAALNVVRDDLESKGWYTYVRVRRSVTLDTTTLYWSTKPFKWWHWFIL